MRMKSLSACGLLGIGLAAGFGLATVGVHATNYLAKVGPPPLRIEPPRKVTMSLPPLPEEKPAPRENTNHVEAFDYTPTLTLMTDVVLSVLAEKGLLNDAGQNSMLSMLPEQASTFTAVSFAAPRQNEMMISPQMLVDYFRPTAGITNSGGASVSVPVEFLPATPTPPASSSATYRSQ
jgi:hypothetical protein